MINRYMITCKKCGEQSIVPDKYTPCPVCVKDFLSKQKDDTTLGDHYDADNGEYIDSIKPAITLTVDQQIRIAALSAASVCFSNVKPATPNNVIMLASYFIHYITTGECRD